MQLGKEGRYLGGHVPYGFDLVCYSHSGFEKWRVFYEERYRRIKITNHGKPNEFRELFEGKNNAPAHELNDKMRLAPTINKHRIEVVKKIFQWFANELISLRTLATRLNELGFSPIYGEGWYASRLRPMLSNPAYIGMPTWNKKGHGKAIEFKDGKLQKVPWKKGKAKKGRVKKPTDHASPRPEFRIEAIIDESTWQKVQERLHGLKSYQKSPRNPELWLAGMLLCGKCGKKMIGWAGSKGKYRGHSYTCSNYRKFGKTNPSGCRLHKISNNLLEKIIESYVHEAQAAISELICSGFDLEILRPFLDRLGANEAELFQIKRKMKDFITPYLLPDQLDCLGMEDIGLPISDTYDELFQREKARLKEDLTNKTDELERLIYGLSQLSQNSTIAHEIGKRKITELDTQISKLKGLLEPLSDQIIQVMDQLKLIDSQIAEAIVSINGNSISKKAKSLRKIIANVICHFRYTDDRGNKPSSILDWVEVVPLAGDPKKICIHKEMAAGRDFIAKAISKNFSIEEIDRIKRSLGIKQGLVKNPAFLTPDIQKLKNEGHTNHQISKILGINLKMISELIMRID
jgi:hypothetical protein